jgi:Fe-S cluster assembly protein SufD
MEEIITTISPKEKLMALLSSGRYQDAASKKAIAALQEFALPTTRNEEWKYTRTARIAAGDWSLSKTIHKAETELFSIPELNAIRLIFVDGVFDETSSDLSQLPKEITLDPDSADSLRKSGFSDFFDAFQTAMRTSCVKLKVAFKFNAERPIHIIHIATSSGALIQPQVEIICQESSHLHLVESFVSTNSGAAFTNRRLNIKLEKNASLHVDKIQMETSENFMINNEEVILDNDCRFTINTLTVESNWVRNQLHIELDGQNIEANLHGFYLPVKKNFVDNHTRVDHLRPHCVSNELYKGMLNDQSSAVFNGKVYVHLDAQKTNAFQSNANILLSDDAQMNTKPELEIYADDVKCSHGTTTGQLDESALFYLKSRGLGEDNARKLLANAFISDVLNKVENDAIRSYVTGQLIQRDLLFA